MADTNKWAGEDEEEDVKVGICGKFLIIITGTSTRPLELIYKVKVETCQPVSIALSEY